MMRKDAHAERGMPHKGGMEVSCGGEVGTLIAICCEKMDEAK